MAIYEGRTANPLVPGRKVVLRGVEFVIPPIDLERRERLDKEFEAVLAEGTSGKERTRCVIEIAHAAMVDNYPDLTLAQVKRLIDLETANPVFYAALGKDFPKPGEA